MRVSVRVLFALLAGLLLLGGTPAPPPSTATGASSFTLTSIDLHDGMMLQSGGTYYLYGSIYGCGYTWLTAGTPWCGFGVSTASSMTGPWSTPVVLFDPNAVDPFTGTSWQTECGGTGAGCFNPRMIQRTGWGANDGVWILWFNSPADYNRNHANAYNAMGCNGPAGPCGYTAPNGSYHKPSLDTCAGNGDFTIVTNGTNPPEMLCTQPNQTLSAQQIGYWGVDGVPSTGSNNLAALTNVEAPGAYWDAGSSHWILTYSDPNCGYCAGDGTGYATATSLTGPWTAPSNPGFAAPATGRRDLSATSCGGQPRTVSLVDGVPWQGIDLWTGSANETAAALHFEQLTYTGQTLPWQPFTPWPCQ